MFKLDRVGHAYNPSYSRSRGRRIMSLRLVWAKLVRFYFNNKQRKKTSKRAGITA
jgi:hypothetical protein